MREFGAQFSGVAGGHVGTDIAGAAASAGLMLLEAQCFDITKAPPGSAVLIDGQDVLERALLGFLAIAASALGLVVKAGAMTEIPAAHAARRDIAGMTGQLRGPLKLACEQAGLRDIFRPYVAADSAMRLVVAGHKMGIIDQQVGRTIAARSLIAGARIVPRLTGVNC